MPATMKLEQSARGNRRRSGRRLAASTMRLRPPHGGPCAQKLAEVHPASNPYAMQSICTSVGVVGGPPTMVASSVMQGAVATRRDGCRDATVRHRQGADEAVGVCLSSPLRSKIEALPDGTSITVILSVSFWMYWY